MTHEVPGHGNATSQGVVAVPSAVRCMVEECVYNEKLHCSAASILVKKIGNEIVGTERGTCCDTFSYQSPDHKPDHS
ncbi:DUF1540 domain-containing protein [Ferroacidibacillus organovorans]|uniref:DUF1540 domain-containing protein n=1 Tax=Ferroacidibacillus organovorans TaxID=1765683 RepID=UPI002FFA2701